MIQKQPVIPFDPGIEDLIAKGLIARGEDGRLRPSKLKPWELPRNATLPTAPAEQVSP